MGDGMEIGVERAGAPPTGDESTLRASYNPATGALLGQVPLLRRDGIAAALRAAREAQGAWGQRPPHERAAVLARFRDGLVADLDAVAKLVSMEQGRPVIEAIGMEALPVLDHLRWLLDEGVALLAGRSRPQGARSARKEQSHWEPLGVVAIIAPWNSPFGIPTLHSLTALLAGNAVVLRPSPLTPLVAQKIAELMRQAELPNGLFTVIHIEEEDVPALTGHPALNKIVFTGSAERGREVMASAAQGPTPVVLELAGPSVAIVAPDADVRRAARGIVWGAMANSGQSPTPVGAVWVQAALYDSFVEEARRLVERLRVGEGIEPGTEIGPLISEQQLARVEAQVEEARADGARVLAGGYRLNRPGFFYAPTVLADVAPQGRFLSEGQGGPVLPILRVPTLDEAVAHANGAGWVLAASVWTSDEQLGAALAGRLRAANVSLNSHPFQAEPMAAWNSAGQRGSGRMQGEWGLLEMVAPRTIVSEVRGGGREPWSFPYDEDTAHFLRNRARLLHGPGARRPWALLSLLLNPRVWRHLLKR